jgi:hypothetical protein
MADKKSSKDQHTSNRMVRLPIPWHELLRQMAERGERSLARELRIALRERAERIGMEIPPGLEG